MQEAVAIVMDVGKNSTVQSGRSGRSFFERAKECAKKIILKRILAKSANDEIGIILFGSDETKNDLNTSSLGFDNVYEMGSLQVANWEMVKMIDKIEPGTATCDWVDGLLVAINYIRTEAEARKFTNIRVILLTNFLTETNDDDVEVIIKNITDNCIELVGV
jgi:hypothetical protein